MQPGDNFAVAASLTETYRDSITLNSSDGSKLVDSTNKTIPVSGATNTDNVPAIRTEMLTVWRRLHIEVDSMGIVANNLETGTLVSNQIIGTGTAITLNLNPANPLEPNRFENGRLEVTSRTTTYSFNVVDHTPTTTANTANTVTINNPGPALTLGKNPSFKLYDDDDMDDEDVGNLNGDEGDNVPEPDLGLLTPNEVPCSNVFNINNCNILVSAYVRPTYDLSTSHENTTFYANANDAAIESIRRNSSSNCNFFQNCNLEANTNFWTIYLLGAYQYTISEDGDPDTEGPTLGLTDGVAANDGEGSVIFNEVNRPHEYDAINILNPSQPDWKTRPINKRFTVAHEVGHLFGGTHLDNSSGTNNAGLMAQSFNRSSPLFTDTTINIIRGGTMLDHP